MNQQNDIEMVKDQLQRGLITTAEANIQMVRDERYRLITHLSNEIRKYLNDGVKAGMLGHLRKDGLKPEAYYHPNFKHLAIGARNKIANAKMDVIEKAKKSILI
jgi:hypothetical protein